ncbi:MAG: hypothetical protein KBC50_00620 [Candidatus Pacebacteria bacterium]|nr:hypothetical protein [Candidatus Paceibacterota bacterium]
MHIQVTQSKDGSHALNFDYGSRRDVERDCKEGDEKVVAFIPLASKDSGIQALAAIGTLAIEASKTGKVPLEALLQKLFEAGVACGKLSR